MFDNGHVLGKGQAVKTGRVVGSDFLAFEAPGHVFRHNLPPTILATRAQHQKVGSIAMPCSCRGVDDATEVLRHRSDLCGDQLEHLHGVLNVNQLMLGPCLVVCHTSITGGFIHCIPACEPGDRYCCCLLYHMIGQLTTIKRIVIVVFTISIDNHYENVMEIRVILLLSSTLTINDYV